ncbi:MAG: hypothetical protein ACM3W4_09570 [Ignavibacteriales bacterium]
MTQLPTTEQILKVLSAFHDHGIPAERIAKAFKLDLGEVLDLIRLYDEMGRPPRRSRIHAPAGILSIPRDSLVH